MTDPMTVLPGAIVAGDHETDLRKIFRRVAMRRMSLSSGAVFVFCLAIAEIGLVPADTVKAELQAVSSGTIEAQLPPIDAVTAAPIAIVAENESRSLAPAEDGFVTNALAESALRSEPVALASIEATPSFEVQPRSPQELIQFDDMRIPRWIIETILRASEDTGVDPVYMMALADKESSFIPTNKASSSSAEGLFQFVNSTWLEVVKVFGPKHGLAAEAAAIETISGELTIADEAMRERVLDLRRDPYLSALMAAEMLKRDRSRIERRLGREITRSEFYLAHFFGVASASKFMSLVEDKPKQKASRVFPAAARANKNLFFAKKGKKMRHLSVAEVYKKLDRMIDKRLDRYEDVTAVVTADVD